MHESDLALFNTDAVLAVDAHLVDSLKRRAREAPSGRFRLCLHQSTEDTVQEMIVVHRRDNYSRPHAHPSTASSLLLLDGALNVLLFDDDGTLTRTIELAPRGSDRPFALRLAPNVWHMPVCRTELVVFYETMTGPFRRDTINAWAPWSPEEHDHAGIAAFRAKLRI